MTIATPIRWFSIAISMTLAAAAARADPAFFPYTATYEVTRNGSAIGRVEVSLTRRDDGLWRYRIDSEATAWYLRMLGISTTESAWFQWRGDRLLPLTYHHVAREPGRDRFWQHRYDWAAGISETRTHEGDRDIELEPGTVDPLTLRLAAVQRIAEQAPAFESFTLPVLERDEIERQAYRFLRRARIEADGRCFDTAVFERHRKPGSSRNYTAFHAESLNWMPVRIVHDDDGKTIALTLTGWHSGRISLPPRGDCGREADTA
jgi:hypothetical protein